MNPAAERWLNDENFTDQDRSWLRPIIEILFDHEVTCSRGRLSLAADIDSKLLQPLRDIKKRYQTRLGAIHKKDMDARMKDMDEILVSLMFKQKMVIANTIEAVRRVTRSRKMARETSGMLLSSQHKDSDLCAAIMKEYEDSLDALEDILESYDQPPVEGV